MLRKHPTGSAVSDDQRPEGWEAVRSVQGRVVIGGAGEAWYVTLYSVGGTEDTPEVTQQH